MTGDDPYAERKRLTFAQAEGLEPLPTQLARGQISQPFRAVLWSELKEIFEQHRELSSYGDNEYLVVPWARILRDAHVHHHHRLDEFPEAYKDIVAHVQKIV